MRLADLVRAYDGGKTLSDAEICGLLSKLRTTKVRNFYLMHINTELNAKYTHTPLIYDLFSQLVVILGCISSYISQARRSDISYKLGWEAVEKRKIITGNESKQFINSNLIISDVTSYVLPLTSYPSLLLLFSFFFFFFFVLIYFLHAQLQLNSS